MWKQTKFRAFLALLRPGNSLFAGFSVLLSGVLAGDLTDLQPEYLLGFAAVSCLAMGIFAINDYCDVEIDTINRRNERPLTRGLLVRKTALWTGGVFLLVSCLGALLLPRPASEYLLLNVPIFFLYSCSLKKHFLTKNLIAAYGFFFLIIFGTLLSDAEVEPISFYFACMCFIMGLGFEIMIDIADVSGDKLYGVRTIAVSHSKKFAAKLTGFFYIGVMFLDPLPFFVDLDPGLYRDNLFLLLILVPVTAYYFVLRALLKDQSEREVLCLKKRVLLIMQFGSLTYLIRVLI